MVSFNGNLLDLQRAAQAKSMFTSHLAFFSRRCQPICKNLKADSGNEVNFPLEQFGSASSLEKQREMESQFLCL